MFSSQNCKLDRSFLCGFPRLDLLSDLIFSGGEGWGESKRQLK
jgi:hypothetical protein